MLRLRHRCGRHCRRRWHRRRRRSRRRQSRPHFRGKEYLPSSITDNVCVCVCLVPHFSRFDTPPRCRPLTRHPLPPPPSRHQPPPRRRPHFASGSWATWRCPKPCPHGSTGQIRLGRSRRRCSRHRSPRRVSSGPCPPTTPVGQNSSGQRVCVCVWISGQRVGGQRRARGACAPWSASRQPAPPGGTRRNRAAQQFETVIFRAELG